jgi:hypothetical protein
MVTILSKTLIFITQKYRKFNLITFKTILNDIKIRLIYNMSFLISYFKRNELLWVDGFLIDFLQKKSVDI